jgi:cyclase
MIKKRLIGVVTIRNNMAVQSFGYDKYLPLGNPVNLIENLDRWGADEILVQVIDRSRIQNGPDFELLETLSTRGLSTPLIYSGGINSHEMAIEVIKKGADRVVVDSAFHSDPQIVKNITQSLGNQAVILALPVHIIKDCLFVFNYLLKCDIALDKLLLNIIESSAFRNCF